MKKRVFSALLALVLTLSAVVLPASAAGSFSDVSDKKTAQNVEVLRLLGVVEGNGIGQFNPYAQLTRAEFCKMLVTMMGSSDVLRYKTVTIFPDVRASHWAARYVNYAVRGEKLLAGLPDGTFQPDRAISYGEAVTILMRLLRTDADAASGGIWPEGYIDLAKASGVSAGVELAGGAAISRAQAAQLFVNVLGAKATSSSTDKDGETSTTTRVYNPANCVSRERVTLIALNGNTARVSGGKKNSYDLVRPSSATVLNGLKGDLLLDADGKVLTFVPVVSSTTGAAVSNAAVILSADKSTSGISALTGGRTDFAVYRNGVLSSVSALRRNDVVTYDASSNTLYACDTRVAVYYEACDPSPSAPSSTISVAPLDMARFSAYSQSVSFLMQFSLSSDSRLSYRANTFCETESMSPTSISGSSPAASKASSPLSAAMEKSASSAQAFSSSTPGASPPSTIKTFMSFSQHSFDDGLRVIRAEKARTHHQHIRARLDDLRRIALLHAAVHFDEDVAPRFRNHLADFRDLCHAVLPERLPAEARLHRHHQHEVAQRQQRFKRFNRRFRIDAHARFHAQRVNGFQHLGAVVVRFRMHGNQIRARPGVILDVFHRLGEHQVRIQKQFRLSADGAHEIRPEADVRRKMPIHVIQMQPVNAQRFHHPDFFAQTHQIRAQHGRRNFNLSVAHS